MSYEVREVKTTVAKLELPITVEDIRAVADYFLKHHPNGTELKVTFGSLSGLVITGPADTP